MAQLIFSSVGASLGGHLLPGGLSILGGQLSGALIGQALGSVVGSSIDNQLFGQHVEGPRIRDIHVTESREGASVPFVLGRSRVGGQVIWAARFREHSEGSGGGKLGPSQTRYSYTMSFAVGICRGPIHDLSRIWAGGQAFDLRGVNWRLYKGEEDQLPDPVMEAIEGSGNVPAFRGLSYIVFEDLPLDAFGARIPQFSFEVLSNPSTTGFESLLGQVNMIPGSGEFAYATEVVRRRLGPGEEVPENMNNYSGRADFELSLDQLSSELPNVDHVNLVVAWFGDDLRCDHCRIRPGVERRDKTTTPLGWSVSGTDRGSAWLVSRGADGRPAYGGTPSDESVFQAVRALKQRGYRVTLYPFILMDVPEGNGLPDPYGGSEQAAHPWRGRITLPVAVGRSGTIDGTSSSASAIRSFFGTSHRDLFSTSGSGQVSYGGSADWRYRHFIMHHAVLAESAGADGILIGSEMPGLTRVRDGSGSATAASSEFRTLAADIRSVVGSDTEISYAADWTEYGGYVPAGTSDLLYPLDSLWADDNIDYVGLDWYAPIADIRPGSDDDLHDIGYLQSNIEGGEAYDWYYASEESRSSGERQTITSGPYDQAWAYRQKDIRNWWSNDHYERISGRRRPTSWRGGSKPIRFVEFGYPAVDKGANQPNVFYDPKSSESALPRNSDGSRDDLGQRRALEAFISYWSDPSHNPQSASYMGEMISGAAAWAWDARPYPAFPTRVDVWGDGGSWRTGHWLNGRAGIPSLEGAIEGILAAAGLEKPDASTLIGVVSGYSIEGPVQVRRVLEPLQSRFGFEVITRGKRLVFTEGGVRPVSISADDLVVAEEGVASFSVRRERLDAETGQVRIRFIDAGNDYLAGMEAADGDPGAPTRDVVLPMVMDREEARARAADMLMEAKARSLSCAFGLPIGWVELEPGDFVELNDATWRIRSVSDGAYRQIEAVRAWRAPRIVSGSDPVAGSVALVPVTPELVIVDAPALPGEESDARPLVFARALPWTGPLTLYGEADTESPTERARIESTSVMGRLMTDLSPGFSGRWMRYAFDIELSGGQSVSLPERAVLSGGNSALVETLSGWELLQYGSSELIGSRHFRLSSLLRGQQGSEGSAVLGAASGARIIILSGLRTRIEGMIEPEVETSWRAQTGSESSSTDWNGVYTHVPVADKQWSPSHLRVEKFHNDWTIKWIRRARFGGDSWTREEPPLEGAEGYRVEIVNPEDGAVVRHWTVSEARVVYTSHERSLDGGYEEGSGFVFRVAQIGPDGRPGHYSEMAV